MHHTRGNNAAVPYLILKQCLGRMASAISEGGWTVRFSRVRTETPLAGRMLVLLQGGVGELEGGETGRGDGATVEESGTEREKERERKREGGHLAIKNTY